MKHITVKTNICSTVRTEGALKAKINIIILNIFIKKEKRLQVQM